MSHEATRSVTVSSRVIGEQNAHVLNCLATAHKAGLRLAEKGYTLLDVEIGTRRRPVLWIARSKRCADLHGVTHIRRASPDGKQVVLVATSNCDGVQVQWVEPETGGRR